MAIVTISPDEQQRPYLEAGTYGPGLDHDAEVVVTKFEYPAMTRAPGWSDFDSRDDTGRYKNKKSGKVEGPFAWAQIRVTTSEGVRDFIDHFMDQPPAIFKFVETAGAGSFDDQGNFVFDDQEVGGRELGGIELKAPREVDGVMYTGNVRKILAK